MIEDLKWKLEEFHRLYLVYWSHHHWISQFDFLWQITFEPFQGCALVAVHSIKSSSCSQKVPELYSACDTGLNGSISICYSTISCPSTSSSSSWCPLMMLCPCPLPWWSILHFRVIIWMLGSHRLRSSLHCAVLPLRAHVTPVLWLLWMVRWHSSLIIGWWGVVIYWFEISSSWYFWPDTGQTCSAALWFVWVSCRHPEIMDLKIKLHAGERLVFLLYFA